jgi:tetratricopeptide (TPR) repeat protein
VVAGSQGNDIAAFSKMGVVLWKARTDEPVLQLAISSNGDCIYVTDGKYIYSYNRSGKLLFRYSSRDPVVSIATGETGEYLAASLPDRVILMRNREMARQTAAQSDVLLENVQRLGVDVQRASELFARSRTAFDANDYETGTEMATEARNLVEAAKSGRAEELTSSVRRVIDEARSSGSDVAKAEGILKTATESLRRGQLDRVLLLLGQAREEAEIAGRVREGMLKAEKETKAAATRKAIQDAIAVTDDAVEYGIDAGQAEILLQKAIAAADGDEYDRAMIYIRQLEEFVRSEKEKLPAKTEESFRMAVEIIARENVSNEEVEKARGLLSSAIVFYDKSGDIRKLADCYERLGLLEERRGKISYSKFLYQKAVNAYFKVGEIDQVLTFLVDRMKRLEAISDKKVYDYTIEELFLIFRDGRLIIHNTRRLRPSADNQILGGMLVAIQNFVQESFKEREIDLLNELRYGKTRILIEKGTYVYLALVTTGQEPPEKREEMKRIIAEI